MAFRSIIVALVLLVGHTASAQEEIWSAMVLASNPPAGQSAAAPPPELAEYMGPLKKAFPYQQFEILGSASKRMVVGQERWLVPSPTFMLGVEARPDGKGYQIGLDLFQDKRRLVQTRARLGLQSPLFISGPRHSRGQLIIVFEIRR
jgi:hypothetical protein